MTNVAVTRVHHAHTQGIGFGQKPLSPTSPLSIFGHLNVCDDNAMIVLHCEAIMSKQDNKYRDMRIFEVPLSRRETLDKGARRRYPFDMLKVGEAFEIGKDANRQSLGSCASRYGKRHGKRFIVRKVDGVPCCIRVE